MVNNISLYLFSLIGPNNFKSNYLNIIIMYNQIENRKGEKLYIFTISNTNLIKPYTYVNTWEECTKELDNDSFFAQIIHKNISEETHTAEASDIDTLVLGVPFIKVNNTKIDWEMVNLSNNN